MSALHSNSAFDVPGLKLSGHLAPLTRITGTKSVVSRIMRYHVLFVLSALLHSSAPTRCPPRYWGSMRVRHALATQSRLSVALHTDVPTHTTAQLQIRGPPVQEHACRSDRDALELMNSWLKKDGTTPLIISTTHGSRWLTVCDLLGASCQLHHHVATNFAINHGLLGAICIRANCRPTTYFGSPPTLQCTSFKHQEEERR